MLAKITQFPLCSAPAAIRSSLILFDPESGAISHALVTSGGIFGVGATGHLVSLEELDFAKDDERAVLRLDRRTFEQLAPYDPDGPGRLPSPPLEPRADRRHDEQTAPARQQAVDLPSPPAPRVPPVPRSEPVRPETPAPTYPGAERAAVPGPDATIVPGAGMEDVRPEKRASELIGADVVDSVGEKIGKLHDLVLHAGDGEIRYAVLSIGGFLGIGDSRVAYPVKDLPLDTRGERIELPVRRDALESADSEAREWLTSLFEKTPDEG